MKILMLAPHFGLDGPSRGILALAKYARRHGVTCEVCSVKNTDDPIALRQLSKEGIPHHSLGGQSAFDARVAFRLFKLLGRGDFDAVDASNYLAGWLLAAVRPMIRSKAIYTIRSDQYVAANIQYAGALAKVVNSLDGWAIRRVDSSIYVSEELAARYVSRRIVVEGQAVAVPNSIDVEDIRVRERQARGGRQKVAEPVEEIDTVIKVVCVGSLTARKNFSLVVRAIDGWRPFGRKIQLRIIGAGPERQALQREIRSRSMEDYVSLIGSLSDPVPELIGSHIICMPSLAEGIPRAVMEAMSLGVVPILSNIAGHRELVSSLGETLLFEQDDIEGIRACISSVCRDKRTFEVLSGRCRELVETKFNVAEQVISYLSHVQKLVHENR